MATSDSAPASDQRTLVSSDGSGSGQWENEAAPLPAGSAIGRYVVRERIGAGGMGVVYLARDPELDRDVALKLVHSGGRGTGGRDGREMRARVQREARAMAKLSHPNVVAIYDVGEHDDGVYIAMELLRGVTLARWLEQPRTVRAVLDVFLAAGRGLIAAHAAGLVHRDFKPDNVIVDDDTGRVTVTDFGLARAIGDADSRTEMAAATPAPLELTRPGALAGTPAYMAPEQHRAQPTDPRTDQFAFCVALYEALFHRHPFTGANPAELAAQVIEGRMQPPPRQTAVPRRVTAAVLRGLQVDPAARWPKLDPLLAALQPAASPRRRTIAAALGIAAVGTTAWAWASVAGSRCAEAGRSAAQIWDESRAQEVRTAFAATHAPDSDDMFGRVRPRLDAYATALGDAAIAACEAHRTGEHTAEQLDAQMRCLGRRRNALTSVLDVFATADTGVVARALASVAALPDVRGCEDLDTVARELVPPAESAAEIADVRVQIALASASFSTGRPRAAVETAELATARAETIGWDPLVAEALYELGRAQEAIGEPREGAASLERSYWAAVGCGDDVTAARASIELVRLVGQTLRRLDDASAWEQQATSAVARLGVGAAQEVALVTNQGILEHARGNLEESYALADTARALAIAHHGEQHPTVALPLQNMGGIRLVQGRPVEARGHLEAAHGILVDAWGADHPSTAKISANLGFCALQLGQFDDALARFEHAARVLELHGSPAEVVVILNNLSAVQQRSGDLLAGKRSLERALELSIEAQGRDHPDTATALSNLGRIATKQGDYASALVRHQEALDIRERVLGPEHADSTYPLEGIASVYVQMGRPADARPYYERALAIAERTTGPQTLRVALLRLGLGQALLELGEHARATAQIEGGLTIRERDLPPDHPEIAEAQIVLANARRLAGRVDEAVALAEKAESSALRGTGAPEPLGEIRLALAQALWDRDGRGDRARARELVRTALAQLADDTIATGVRAQAEQFLAEHPL